MDKESESLKYYLIVYENTRLILCYKYCWESVNSGDGIRNIIT